ncbi:MAG: thioredoxin family protein, partial [Gammaproteobacteria bacterium]|nr:thioredoxin family protein [Gammaproteobacteria bacterium]
AVLMTEVARMASSQPTSAGARVTILDFWAEWCGICRLIDPVVKRIVDEHDDVGLLKIDVKQERALMDQHDVKGLPTLVFVSSSGQELERLAGTMTGKQIETALADAYDKLA